MTTTATLPEKRTQEATPVRESTRTGWVYVPNVDILETEEELRVYADMPGVDPDKVDVTFENGVLTIHGRVEPRQPENQRYLRREYGIGDFRRVFEVSESIDAERISAEYRDGVLVLHLPKVEAARPRRIQVVAR